MLHFTHRTAFLFRTGCEADRGSADAGFTGLEIQPNTFKLHQSFWKLKLIFLSEAD
jgi:hypothetical protein